MEVSNVAVAIICSLLLIAMISYIFIIYTIRKNRINENRYYLIALLSITDFLKCLNVIMLLSLYTRGLRSDNFLNGLVLILYMLDGWSIFIVAFASADRFCAIRFSLQYNNIMTTKKMNTCIGVIFAVHLVLVTVLVVFTTDRFGRIAPVSLGLMSYNISIRLAICIFAILTNVIILSIRKRKLLAVGTTADEISYLTSIKRGIKDIIVLNFWAIFIFLLQIVIAIWFLTSKELFLTLRKINFVLFILNCLLNPFAYIITQKELRERTTQFFERIF